MKPLHRPGRLQGPPRQQRGIVLAVALITLGLTALGGTLLLGDSRRQAQAASNQVSLAKAQFAAERGVREALDQMVAGQVPPFNSGSSPVGAADQQYSYTVAARAGAVDASGQPLYQITSSGFSGPARRQVQTVVALSRAGGPWGNAIVGCNGVKFDSSGNVSSYLGTTTGRANATVRTLGTSAPIVVTSSYIVRGAVRATGNLTVDSSAQVAGDAFVNGNMVLTNASQTYAVTGNGTAGGTIDRTGKIQGTRTASASPLPVVTTELCDPLGLIGGSGTGTTFNAVTTVTAPPTTTTSGHTIGASDMRGPSSSTTIGADGQTTNLYRNGNFSLSGSSTTRTIRGSVRMHVTGNITLTDAKINLATGADLTIYVGGDFRMIGSPTLNWTTVPSFPAMTGHGDPSKVVIYSRRENSTRATAYDSAGIGLDSNPAISALIYAPRSSVYMTSNTRHVGSIRGKWVDFNSNGALSYSESLKDVGGGPVEGYRLAFWSDVPYDKQDYAAP